MQKDAAFSEKQVMKKRLRLIGAIDKKVTVTETDLKISHLLDLLVDNDANSMLGYVVHTACFAMITLVRHSFLDCTCTLKNNTQ